MESAQSAGSGSPVPGRRACRYARSCFSLHSHGVSTGRAVRIFKTYGNLAIQTVQENPYTLAKEIHGIGFGTADHIAQSVGVPRDSQNRARAGIDHVLLGATSEGE